MKNKNQIYNNGEHVNLFNLSLVLTWMYVIECIMPIYNLHCFIHSISNGPNKVQTWVHRRNKWKAEWLY